METDVQRGLKLERDRYVDLIEGLNREEREVVRCLKANLAHRGLLQSGDAIKALIKVRSEKLERIIDGAVTIRMDIATEVPELATDPAIDNRLAELVHTLGIGFDAFLIHEMPTLMGGAVAQAVTSRNQEEVDRLQALARRRFGILKGEISLNMHRRMPHSIAVNTAGGPAIVTTGDIYGSVQQVVGTLNERGQAEIAEHLSRLAAAIEAATELGDDREAYLEQVQVVAEQAVAPPEERKPTRVRGVLLGLRAALGDAANAAKVLDVAGPAIAHYFGFPWMG